MPDEIWRIMDANFDRAAEGLRVLDDIARLGLDAAALSQDFRRIRHAIAAQAAPVRTRLVSARAADADPGASAAAYPSDDLAALAAANAARAAEALRVLEEMAKLPETRRLLRSDAFRSARFALYTAARTLHGRLTRRDRAARVRGLYAVLDTALVGDRDIVSVARRVIDGGATVIQLRDKHEEAGPLLRTATALRELCAKRKVLFIVNDRVDIALASSADGVHLGQDDMPAAVARRLLPLDAVIGVSVYTVAQARRAEAEGADYIGAGAVFPTGTKPEATVLGLKGLAAIRKAVSIPAVAIGGINESNAAGVIGAGVPSIAVASAVLGAPDVKQAALRLSGLFKKPGATRSRSPRR